IDSENGITFKTTDESNTIIKLSDLSSGEKQEVILLYNLLFNMPEGSVLLIDEPETSLHVAWAKEFMDDIEKILKLKKSQALIATHSPFIIGERWAQTIDLTAMSASPRSKAWS
ncbi:MAG: ATP-binding protein, partial [Victivallales bacterium]|nr:ATP-binding protein [Victivallales bacterium]